MLSSKLGDQDSAATAAVLPGPSLVIATLAPTAIKERHNDPQILCQSCNRNKPTVHISKLASESNEHELGYFSEIFGHVQNVVKTAPETSRFSSTKQTQFSWDITMIAVAARYV